MEAEEWLLVVSRQNPGDSHVNVYGPCTGEQAREIAARELAKWKTVNYQWVIDPKVVLDQ